MTKAKYFVSEQTITLYGYTFTVTRINNDLNGNPRYVVSGHDLEALYGRIPAPFKPYRAKWYGGGYVIQSYDIAGDIRDLPSYNYPSL